MKILCSKDYCGSIILYRDSNIEKRYPIHLIKGTYYNVLPTVGGYIIGYTQDISFFIDTEKFDQYFNPNNIKVDILENKDITLDKHIMKDKDSQIVEANDNILKNYNKLYNLNKYTIKKLIELGVLKTDVNSCRNTHIGKSDYSHKIIQPWTIWMEYKLNAWDADIIKRVLRTKEEANMTPEAARKMDYEKIIHDAKERIRQLDIEIQNKINKKSNED